ncbi:hypothetical protein C1H46_042240 [Malus baccata]|uniref:Zinc/iron permease n=1 Tax=Malus baccata TaxID=106549 RepID=A0A540KE50_MALBA|nr:hypothetical protein C1H46_042240 [Malus baccata]
MSEKVSSSMIRGLRVGVNLALAIALHNIPEGGDREGSADGCGSDGMIVLPLLFRRSVNNVGVHFRTGLLSLVHFLEQLLLHNKWQAFKLATLSGLAEPLGVVIVAYLFPSSLSPEILEGLLGSVGGVMAFLTLHEMLPLAFDYAGQKQAVKAVFLGMAFMSASLYFLEISLPQDMSL